jgi:hypothetical protein
MMYRKFSPRAGVYALLLAVACMLLTPLSASACGGVFSADAPVDQNAERLIFSVDPGQVTLYEQINYSGSPKNFAWILPVPALPQVGIAPLNLFSELDSMTTPRFSMAPAPECPGLSGAGAPASSSSVNVYSNGAVGPYSYNVIGSSDPHAVTQWLSSHHYEIPSQLQAEIQPYVAAHMLFLAMRLQGNASVQDIAPVKVTFATSQPEITIPLRMAASTGNIHMGILVWIFAHDRYVPQNYQSLQLDYNQLSNNIYNPAAYPSLIDQAVSKVNGHGFVTEYAQPTSNLSLDSQNQPLAGLLQRYSYLTRLYTRISPAQMNLDPSFIAQTGQPNVSPSHEFANPASSQPLSCPPSPLAIGGLILAGVLVVVVGSVLLVVIRRRTPPVGR